MSNISWTHFFCRVLCSWRLRWKKGARFFTQNWTLSKTLQISHAVLFRCAKQCSVCFSAEVFFVYEILRMQKSLYLWCHQHVTGKTVISLIIQQNIDVLQRVTLKSVDFRVKLLQNLYFMQRVSSKTLISGQNRLECWFYVKAWRQGCWFDLKTNKIFISCSA